MDLTITVREVKGHCPVFREGDHFELRSGYQLVTDIPLCMHALSSLMPFYNALRISGPDKWGLASKEHKDRAYIQCPDALPYTDGGTVIFEISRTQKSSTR